DIVPEPAGCALLAMASLGALRRRKRTPLLALALGMLGLAALPGTASANPGLTVQNGGINSNFNREWIVSVAPDVTDFNNNKRFMALELGMAATGSTFGTATKNAAVWPF